MVVGVLFGVLAICLLLTVPIAVSLGIATIAAGFSLNAVTGNQMLTMLAQTTITASDNTSLLAMPFFMLCGSLMDRSGIAKRLIDVAEAIVGEATGGLGATTIVAAMLFAAISGSGPACVAALGGILIPAMVRRRNDGLRRHHRPRHSPVHPDDRLCGLCRHVRHGAVSRRRRPRRPHGPDHDLL